MYELPCYQPFHCFLWRPEELRHGDEAENICTVIMILSRHTYQVLRLLVFFATESVPARVKIVLVSRSFRSVSAPSYPHNAVISPSTLATQKFKKGYQPFHCIIFGVKSFRSCTTLQSR